MEKQWFAIPHERGIPRPPLMNGDKITDEDGNAFTFISFNPSLQIVSVKTATGEYKTVPGVAFDITFEWETA